jgi:hypothetical protein
VDLVQLENQLVDVLIHLALPPSALDNGAVDELMRPQYATKRDKGGGG